MKNNNIITKVVNKMSLHFKNIILALLIFSGLTLTAQQDALFNQYMFNKLVINPAYAGTSDVLNITLIGRQQWVGIDGAPKTATLSLHSPLKNENMGLGFYVYTDQLGPIVNNGFLGTYSYKVRIGNGKLSFGLQFGVKSEHVDFNKLDLPESDMSYMGTTEKNTNIDANFGIYYYTDKFYVGLSSKHLMETKVGVTEINDEIVYAKLLRHFYGMAGYAFHINDNLTFRPSTLIKFVQDAPIQFDINASFLLYKTLWLGASYRTERSFVLMTQILIGERFRVGYSYDTFLYELSVTNQGSHEIMLGFELPVFNKRMKTIRYF